MAKSTRRARLVIIAIALGLGAVLLPQSSVLWSLLTLKKIPLDEVSKGHRVLGFYTVKRWTDPPERHGRTLTHYVDNGFLSVDSLWKDGILVSSTSWLFDGTVKEQMRENSLPNRRVPLEGRGKPPWWWSVTDQTEPTAPWWGKE